jgi:hypothetical protein
MLFADSCRSLAVTDAVNKHLNKHTFGWCCRSSNNSNAGETVSSTTVAGNLTATSSSNRYYLHFHSFFFVRKIDTDTCFFFKLPKVWSIASMSYTQISTKNWTLSCFRRRTCFRIHLQSFGSSPFVSAKFFLSSSCINFKKNWIVWFHL